MKTLPFVLLLLLIGCKKEPLYTDAGNFVDSRDSHVYKSIKIGAQTWMAENLAYLPMVSPPTVGSEASSIPYLGNTPHYYVYEYEGNNIQEASQTANYSTYGVLYNWNALGKVCPQGWHLPTDPEWKELEDYLGTFEKSVKVGKMLRSEFGWSENSGNNRSGFSALPAGARSPSSPKGIFSGLGDETAYSTIQSFWGLAAYFDGIFQSTLTWDRRHFGYSVRCIKDI